MHSVVETEQQLVVSQERGRIVGGMAVSRLGVSTYAAGSPMGIATLVQNWGLARKYVESTKGFKEK